MTVKELVEWLQKQPQDALVIYQACSTLWDLELPQLKLYSGRMERRVRNRVSYHGLIRHHDSLMDLEEDWLPDWEEHRNDPKPVPNYLTAVAFPGN